MNSQRRPLATPLVWAVLLMGALVALALFINASKVSMGQASGFNYGARNLIGATPQEISRFAQQYAEHNLKLRGGTAQVLLNRSVKRQELATLGIGCLPSSSTVEDPPLVLVILKGEFDFSSMLSSQVGGASYSYVAYVFDTWSAQPAFLLGSRNGAQFRTALNDPTLPEGGSDGPLVCPTEAPRTTTLHYGDVPPTPSMPSLSQTPYPATTVVGLPTVPQPVPTGETK